MAPDGAAPFGPGGASFGVGAESWRKGRAPWRNERASLRAGEAPQPRVRAAFGKGLASSGNGGEALRGGRAPLGKRPRPQSKGRASLRAGAAPFLLGAAPFSLGHAPLRIAEAPGIRGHAAANWDAPRDWSERAGTDHQRAFHSWCRPHAFAATTRYLIDASRALQLTALCLTAATPRLEDAAVSLHITSLPFLQTARAHSRTALRQAKTTLHFRAATLPRQETKSTPGDARPGVTRRAAA